LDVVWGAATLKPKKGGSVLRREKIKPWRNKKRSKRKDPTSFHRLHKLIGDSSGSAREPLVRKSEERRGPDMGGPEEI